MATTTCSQGHESSDPQWCDVCGERIGAAPSAIASPAAPDPEATGKAPVVGAGTAAPPVAPVECPNCSASNDGASLFCEQCGYDFTTGQAPPEAPPAPESPAPAGEPATVPWVVVVEVDPKWYELKGTLADAPLPPANTYTVALHTTTSLIGRTSKSKGVKPDIALDADTGVSRRQAQLVADGTSLSVVDLVSTNGTFVVAPDVEPDADIEPLAPDEVRQLSDGDRVYVGAWTRLTVRST